jgi:hypothetical protein
VCGRTASPADRLRCWLWFERNRPIDDLFDDLEVNRLAVTLAGIIPMGLLLGWSLWSLRPFRLSLRLRIRTLMVVIAVVPIDCTGGVAVWNIWEQWDNYRRLAEYHAAMEKISRERAAELPPRELELDEKQVQGGQRERARAIAEHGRLKRVYERAMWQPWSCAPP